MKQIVIMPGGFHPFHAGHYALYQSILQAFPDADVYVAATNDQSERPFPFNIKEKLAKLAGVAPGRFIQVKSPFKANEITDHYDPNEDVLIFVRSEKDRNEQPKPGGTKKDGTPAYFQPYTGKDLQPFSKHAYMEYLPTVEFGPGITSATQIRKAWPTLNDKRKLAMVYSLYPDTQKKPELAQSVVKIFDKVMGAQGLAEGVNDYLWHGSRHKNNVLIPRQANDTGGAEGSNKNAIYATPSAKVAIAMGLTTPGSDTGMFPNDPQMVLFKGDIRKGQMVYLHKVPKDLFIKHNSREWYSKPDVTSIDISDKDIKEIPVDKFLHLIRKATPQDLELQKKYMKKSGVTESQTAKAGIVQTEVYGTKAYHAKCMEPNCDWESKRYDRIQQAQTAAKKHGEQHFNKKDVAEDKESDPVTKAVIGFYKPVINDVEKEKVPDYVDQARELLSKTDDPTVRKKVLDIFKKGKENPYLQGGIITTVGALLAGGILNSAQTMGLTPQQTNIALQGILNTVIPTLVSRINGRNWIDTIKYTLASAGVGVGIAGLTEDQDYLEEK